jgi:hypothetical protein
MPAGSCALCPYSASFPCAQSPEWGGPYCNRLSRRHGRQNVTRRDRIRIVRGQIAGTQHSTSCRSSVVAIRELCSPHNSGNGFSIFGKIRIRAGVRHLREFASQMAPQSLVGFGIAGSLLEDAMKFGALQRLFDDEGPHALVRKNTRVEIAPNFPYETFGIGIVFSFGHFLQILFCSFSCAVRKGRLFASFPVTRLGINQLVQS